MTRSRLVGLLCSMLMLPCLSSAALRSQSSEPPVVFVAASAAQAVLDAFRAAGTRVVVSPGASSTLAKQIGSGARPTLFVCAHHRWTDWLAEQGLLVAGSRAAILTNQLVFVQSAASAESIEILAGRAFPNFTGRLAMGDPEHVPLGMHAKQALIENAWWSALKDRVLPGPDARTGAVLVARNEAALGIVYGTDALADPRLQRIADLPMSRPVTLEVSAVVGADPATARALREALADPRAFEVFQAAGFKSADGSSTQGTTLSANSSNETLPERTALGGLLTQGEWAALKLSVRVAGLATLAALALAVLLGTWLARSERRVLVTIVESLVVLPLVLPPIVVGYGLLILLGREGVIPTELPFSTAGAGLAAGLMGLPLAVRAIRQAVEAVDPQLEAAAATLGASRFRVFLRITWPLARRGVLAGGLLCFARCLGEFGATITFAGNIPGETRTLPLSIWNALQSPGGETAAWRATVLCVALSVAAAVASEVLLRRATRRERGAS